MTILLAVQVTLAVFRLASAGGGIDTAVGERTIVRDRAVRDAELPGKFDPVHGPRLAHEQLRQDELAKHGDHGVEGR